MHLRQLLTRLVSVAAVSTLTADITAAPNARAAAADPEVEYRSLLVLSDEMPPAGLSDDRGAYLNWGQARLIHLYERCQEFLQKFPDNPLRWNALVLMRYGPFQAIKTLPDGSHQLVQDMAKFPEWKMQYQKSLEGLLGARDANPSARREALKQLISETTVGQLSAQEAGPVLVNVRSWLVAFEKENPRSSSLPSLYQSVAVLLDGADPGQCLTFLREAEAGHSSNESPDPDIRERIAGRLRVLTGQAEPVAELWSRLGELDPRLKDLERYRGKVVLVAMLPATWDGYTKRVENLYTQYHAAGFEVVQIVARNSSVTAPLEQKDKAAHEKYVAAKNWPWFVVWDPTGDLRGFARTWGQNTIPAYLLIARDGRIVNDRKGAFNYAAQIPRELALPASP